jgi:hypothetical protein
MIESSDDVNMSRLWRWPSGATAQTTVTEEKVWAISLPPIYDNGAWTTNQPVQDWFYGYCVHVELRCLSAVSGVDYAEWKINCEGCERELRLGDRVFGIRFRGRGKLICFSQCPARPWGLPSFKSNVYRG